MSLSTFPSESVIPNLKYILDLSFCILNTKPLSGLNPFSNPSAFFIMSETF